MATLWQYKAKGIDDVNKKEFTVFYDSVKIKDTRVANIKTLKEASKSIQSDTQRKSFVAMVTLASDYCEVNDVCNFTMVEWDNMKRLIRQYKYVLKHHGEDSAKVFKSEVGKVYDNTMSPHRYNNALVALLDTLKEKYKVDTKHEVTVEEALVFVDTLNVDAKKAMLEKLMAELGYEVAA